MEQKFVLDKLRVAEIASYDSQAQDHSSFCLPDTRVELLDQICKWVEEEEAEPIFWLNGMAGTGKSTIARTVAKILSEKGQLGATFFFKQGETDRGSLSKFFTTIAADLVKSRPSIVPFIKEVLETYDSITTKSTTEQFEKLMLQPLSQIVAEIEPTCVVVDALDECEQENDIALLLRLFSRLKLGLSRRVKIFLTSRPDLPVREGFGRINGKFDGVFLHELPESVIERDILIYFKYELAQVRRSYNLLRATDQQLASDWPGQSSIDTLVSMSFPLFIAAATTCRFIADRKVTTPAKQLTKVLSRSTDGVSQLGSLYQSVLETLTTGASVRQRKEIGDSFRHIVGSIVLLASPLSIPSLSRLLETPEEDIDNRLALLHSVLIVPPASKRYTPVRIYHLSFREFILNPDDPEMPFKIDAKQTHTHLLDCCLRIMDCLKQDMCAIGGYGIPRSSLCSATINSCLQPEMRYACLYWVHHLKAANVRIDDESPVYTFLTNHFLHWMEALTLMDRIWETSDLIRVLQSQLEVNTTSSILQPTFYSSIRRKGTVRMSICYFKTPYDLSSIMQQPWIQHLFNYIPQHSYLHRLIAKYAKFLQRFTILQPLDHD